MTAVLSPQFVSPGERPQWCPLWSGLSTVLFPGLLILMLIAATIFAFGSRAVTLGHPGAMVVLGGIWVVLGHPDAMGHLGNAYSSFLAATPSHSYITLIYYSAPEMPNPTEKGAGHIRIY